MRSILTLTSLLLALTLSISAQREAITTDGKTVILNADGTWTPKPPPRAAASDDQKTTSCANWILTKGDKVTGRTYSAGKPGFVISDDGKTGLSVITMRSQDSIILSFNVVEPGAGCIDKNAAINILFRDGSRLALRNSSDFNCDGKSTVYFRGVFGNAATLEELKTKEIETIRVSTYKSFVQRDLSKEHSHRLMQELSCLDGM